MEERVCKVMRGTGAWNIVLGIVGIVIVVAGDVTYHQWCKTVSR